VEARASVGPLDCYRLRQIVSTEKAYSVSDDKGGGAGAGSC
jgi:hypothetical protein